MPTAPAIAMDAIVSTVHPALKAAGYRKRGRGFNREPTDGVVHVIHFQMGTPNLAQTAAPGISRVDVVGRFTVNLGVYLRRIEPFDDAPPPTDFVNEYNCHLRRRLGYLIQAPQDRWWPLDDPDRIGALMQELLAGPARSWLRRHESWGGVLAQLEQAGYGSRTVSGNPDRLLATRMRLADGDRAGAQRNLSAWSSTVDPTGAHYPYLRVFARRHGLVLAGE